MTRLPALRLPALPSAPRLGLIPKVVAALAVVALVAGAYAFWPRHDNIQVTGEFTRAVGPVPRAPTCGSSASRSARSPR